MTKIFGHYMPSEMLMLWLVEAVLSFTLIAALLAFGATGLLPANQSVYGGAVQAVDVAALITLAFGLAGSALGLYRRETLLYTRQLLVNIGIVALIVLPALAMFAPLFHADLFALLASREALWLPRILVAWLLCLALTRSLFRVALRHGVFARHILVLGDPDDIRGTPVPRLDDAGFFTIAAPASDPAALDPEALRARKIWGIVIAAAARASLPAAALLRCKSAGIRIFDEVDFRERRFRRLDLDRLPPDWLVFAERAFASRLDQAFKRGFDLLLSVTMLILVLPLMLLAALAIRLDSAGPVFYRQERVGLHGKTFMLLKFRSMRTDAEAAGPTWAAAHDPRITRVGGFLRRTRIDELPQLINVLRGEMSLIGPRPERPHFVAKLAAAIPRYHDRSFVKPGITGWAQVNFPYGASIEDARMKLAYDLYYVARRNFFLDLLILFSTVRVILFREGAR
ncbi:MAG: exopolysaccharide biosynthesis polyprenyl glycosylphosphotransferase [Acidibrevibacterium sp.]|jgi:exopolysaccharide biosynthesis polyprenyl glycosylphosphotransferase|uniref:exopolysaccharide biosynthesis polyprenyl glycosylphosphotransferase n=1 Tax=Acidibrevibacterium fodinaquatile TaxID=1969806 RepID=UPI0023A7EE52|nr:exopolysaccharide biosynthesis polyprenyl glycosylphosphotransferase [Acidibrevibacterium fodinaquatile]MCA7121174.1 exopolysaccharide biosynthesis polyprenyl glycosylphosphotransferase [Acidibrevibacterium fodinaquatile]